MTIYNSRAYLIVDSKRCQGCLSCMLACSMVHHGESNLSLSRIQVMQNILANWPDDIRIAQCRQCSEAPCVEACPTGALYIDSANDNLRIINESECIGCRLCIDACPFSPQRIIFNPVSSKSEKCDLCLETPFWNDGGPGGKHACIEVCPQHVIKVTSQMPEQHGDSGYDTEINDIAGDQV